MKCLEGKKCVFVKHSHDGLVLEGKMGRIISDRDFRIIGARKVLVEFDENIGGHDGNSSRSDKGKWGHCWWCYVKDLRVVEDKYRRL